MSAIKGTWRKGLVTLDEPANWPEGSRVLVERDVADLDQGTDSSSRLSSAEFERLLDELADGAPVPPLPKDWSRADIYVDHD